MFRSTFLFAIRRAHAATLRRQGASRRILLAVAGLWGSAAQGQLAGLPPAQVKEEALFFTPPGFDRVGEAKWDGDPAWSSGGRTGQVEIVVRDADTGQVTPCRINVVGRDGNFYQPPTNRLSRFALTGVYSVSGIVWGNRQGKAPYRYLGRFFYTRGESTVRVPDGAVRVEVWKGFEYRPETVHVQVPAGSVQRVEVKLKRSAPMAPAGYYAGDTHLHLQRESEEDDQVLFDLMAGEDFRYCVNMAWNHPAGPYLGFMDKQVYPQRLLGRDSMRSRGNLHLLSGQEYRNKVYGHLNLFLRDDVVLAGQDVDGDRWPVHGEVGRETMAKGGFAFMAHGGYGQEIYADAALGTISGVELLQFGIYRDMGLEGWYHMLNSGYRFAAHAASDYPGTRYLADSRTYVYQTTPPTMPEWLAGLAAGRSFFTTGPLLLLEVDGKMPGGQIRKQGDGPHRVKTKVRMRCEVTPVTDLELIVNGKVVKNLKLSREESQGRWIELEHAVELGESAWIAARAHSKSPGGFPDAEAHTNPVYVYLNDRAPFQKPAVDGWIAKIDRQIGIHAQRIFHKNARVLAYFQQARDLLLKIRAHGGLGADEDPARLADERNAVMPGIRNFLADGSLTDATDEEMKAYLQPVPQKTPAEALQTFEAVGGFRMELVAADPLIRSPVAAAFDEDGNLYVAELTDYPFHPQSRVRVSWQRGFEPGEEPLGSVRLLRDTNGDGVFDESHVFADKLLWVGGIAPWKGGVYVSSPPDIWYLKDTDGDGKADLRQRVFTGFGMLRQQQFVNSLQFGLDHRIYAATNGNGGEIRPGNNPAAMPVSVNGHDFRFSPDSHRLELQTGTKVFGMSFDDWGNRYLCDQVNPCYHVVLPLEYLERNRHYKPAATIFTTTPSPTSIFRLSPVERWRHIKSSRRFAGTDRPADIVPLAGFRVGLETARAKRVRPATVPGVSHHILDATSGVTIYRGGAYPPEYYGNVFSADSQANLVHRRVLVPSGATFRTERADANTEFLRSSDNWFRPVNFVNAPDGTLYCIDMARQYSESANIPADVEKHMDLAGGRDRGRIYRMAPPGFRPPPPPRLGRATPAELVAALESPHGWWRDTAHRLLFERQDKSAVPALGRLARESASPQARLHALWSLRGLQALDDRAIVAGLRDAHSGVRQNAVRLAEERIGTSAEIRGKILGLMSDPDPRVRLQVAFTIGESRSWNQPALLARMARENLADPWIQSAIISSAADCGGELFAAVAADPGLRANARGIEFLRQVAEFVGAQNRPAEVTRAIDALVAIDDPAVAFPLLGGLGKGLRQSGKKFADVDPAGRTRKLLQRAPAIAADASRPEAVRRAAIEQLSFLSYPEAASTLADLLAPKQPASVQLAAIQLLEHFDDPQVGGVLLGSYSGLVPAAQTRAIDFLLERSEYLEALLDALQSEAMARSDLSARQLSVLRQHGDERVRERAGRLLGTPGIAGREEVVQAYLPVLELAGTAARGRTLFASRCSICHSFRGLGHAFGPDLGQAAPGGREKLLTDILDPNREVAPEYFVSNVEAKSGGSTGGIRKSETADAVTLLLVGGVEKKFSRAGIARINTRRQSLMPEGLESGLSKQDLADLIEFLTKPGS